jgi:hypothetical protein
MLPNIANHKPLPNKRQTTVNTMVMLTLGQPISLVSLFKLVSALKISVAPFHWLCVLPYNTPHPTWLFP